MTLDSELIVNNFRYEVPEDKIPWDVDFPEYEPIEFFAVQPVPIPEDPDYRLNPVNNLPFRSSQMGLHLWFYYAGKNQIPP